MQSSASTNYGLKKYLIHQLIITNEYTYHIITFLAHYQQKQTQYFMENSIYYSSFVLDCIIFKVFL